MTNKINHISFIMDGNNRWSIKNKKTKYYSYKCGAKKLLDLTKFIFENYETKYVSAFALSKHNFKRGTKLINIIEKVLSDFLKQNINKDDYNFRFTFKGDLSFLPKNIFKGINDLEKINKRAEKQLIIYLNYSGKDDIVCASNFLKNYKKINDKAYQKYLKSFNIPDPDMLIRSGGFKRLSDFLLYQVSFTDFFFTRTLWPDIQKSHIKKYINQFKKIDRKFGI